MGLINGLQAGTPTFTNADLLYSALNNKTPLQANVSLCAAFSTVLQQLGRIQGGTETFK